MPEHIRAALEDWAGAPVASAVSQRNGFSPGVAARLHLTNGDHVFVKAVGPTPNPDSPKFHRREARIIAALPDGVPVPRLRWVLDEGPAGWVVLAFDEIDGVHPAQPWRDDELTLVMAGLDKLARTLTPSPLGSAVVPSAGEHVARSISGWRRLLDNPEEGLDPWSHRHLDELAELEKRAPAVVHGNTLLHFDIRADNVLLDSDRVWFVDWPHASVGAAWFDVLAFAPSVTMQGGPPPEELMIRSPACREADPEAITAAAAAIAGFFTRQALLPPPPGLPTLRAFQAAQGAVARGWLATRTGWR